MKQITAREFESILCMPNITQKMDIKASPNKPDDKKLVIHLADRTGRILASQYVCPRKSLYFGV